VIFPNFVLIFSTARCMNLKNYETIFILTPVLNKEQTDEVIQKIRDFLVEKEAKIVHETPIGFKKMAYPIQHKSTGIYHVIEFQANPTVINALETTYKREEKVIRFLTFALDKHAINYNERKRTGNLTPKYEAKQESTV
jgi:small subunit ribosomal protein S6